MTKAGGRARRPRSAGELKPEAPPVDGYIDTCRSRIDALRASLEPRLLRLSASVYLSLDGAGSPDSPQFEEAAAAMFTASYTMKAQKRREGRDFELSTLEGLFSQRGDGPEQWKLLIAVPDFITSDDLERATARLSARPSLSAMSRIKLERIDEGLCAQVLHVGPYATKQGSLDKIRELAAPRGLEPRGPHHEIYLCDMRRTKPEDLRTILRVPVARPGD